MKFLKNKMSVWWVLAFLNLTAFFWLGYFGLFGYILSVDHTYLSFVNIGIYIAAFLFIGWKIKTTPYYDDLEEHLIPVYEASELTMGYGLLGTVVGFILMLSNLNLTATDPAAIQAMMGNMIHYMAMAFFATGTGITASLFLRKYLLLFTRLIP